MKQAWFKEYLQQHLGDQHKDHRLIPSAAEIAKNIAIAAGGNVFSTTPDAEPQDLEKANALRRFEQALTRAIGARIRKPSHLGGYAYRLGGSQASGSEAIEIRERVSINTAGPKKLASLPEIGETLAERIVEHRSIHGRFHEEDREGDVNKLSNVNGISGSTVKKIRHAISYKDSFGEPNGIFVPALEELRSHPNLAGLIQAISAGISISGARFDSDDDLMTRLHAELEVIQDETEGARWKSGALPGMLASEAGKIQHALAAQAQLPRLNNLADATASLLFNSQYPAAVGELIDAAKTSIKILMFYIVPGSSGVDSLLQKLVDAKARGVAVKVVLDKDREGDVYNSREINKAAFELLENNGIDVTFDSDETLLHAKLVVIDDSISVVGSHNWTAGSFYNFEDISVVVHSSAVNAGWSSLFPELA
ncbi:MAG: phospholipase D-like domain-containing protein [Wenzhouxiangellaceae bacterium]